MKNIFLVITKFIAKLIGSILPWRLPVIWHSFTYATYSAMYSKSFKSCGRKFHIEYPSVFIGNKFISIGQNFCSNKRLRIEAYYSYQSQQFNPEVLIGNNVGINYDCHIACINKVTIGNNVLIGSHVLITDHYHGEINETSIIQPPALRNLYSKGPVIIEDNVWIGEGVAIMPGVKIGKNCIIGANSVITKSIPPYSVVAGNPGRVIKTFKIDD